MTRWLEAAQRASGTGKKPNLLKKLSGSEVNSVYAVFSGDRSPCLAKSLVLQEKVPSAHLVARATALADTDGVARSPEAIEAIWDWALALARETKCKKPIDIKK